MSLSPPSLPPYIFLMSDYTTARLARDVADALSAKYPTVFVDDFAAPIHEAFVAMFSLDWKRDMGNVDETNAMFTIPTTDGDGEPFCESERDVLVSLERWFIRRFGETELGKLARRRCDERNEMADYITVFRDATYEHLDGFGALRPIDCLEITLVPDMTVEAVIALIHPQA